MTTTPVPPTIRKGAVIDGENVTIADALEILMYLAGLPNLLDSSDKSMNAARITVQAPNNPTIGCVLEILMYLAGLPNSIRESTV